MLVKIYKWEGAGSRSEGQTKNKNMGMLFQESDVMGKEMLLMAVVLVMEWEGCVSLLLLGHRMSSYRPSVYNWVCSSFLGVSKTVSSLINGRRTTTRWNRGNRSWFHFNAFSEASLTVRVPCRLKAPGGWSTKRRGYLYILDLAHKFPQWNRERCFISAHEKTGRFMGRKIHPTS